ncbi:alpha/beta fold hydrolase [Nocardioides daejeonensis]|uniref:alpha/beta fold hydrolase n=1 Tax=Nocardioides daejeonensis TaxID=1046556 RepID=UPI000D7454DA|nr:alpha/beta fold hydrolase [Nocardioides daejeonensis]
MSSEFEVQYVDLHGYRRAYVKVGSGPALLLIHGLGCNHSTWAPVIETLARRHTVIVPDLLGHGESDKPRADYSIAAYANGMRDLLSVLDIDAATIVGHSLGGGVAMQFAYQFPERTERLVLVAAGGLGPEVTPLIRAITTPGIQPLLALAALPGIRHLGTAALRGLANKSVAALRDLDEIADIVDSFADPRTRTAVRNVTRSVVDWGGQYVTMADRAYLVEGLPICVVWGRDDLVLPVRHANIAAALVPSARIEIMPNSGHFPHRDHPERFAKVVQEFVASTPPARHDPERRRELLRIGGVVDAEAARAGRAPVIPLRAGTGA